MKNLWILTEERPKEMSLLEGFRCDNVFAKFLKHESLVT